MNCSHCGFANDDGSRFCNKCGAAVNGVPSQTPKSTAWKWVLGILVGFCVLSGIVNSLKSKDQSSPSSQSTATQKKPEPPPKPNPVIHPVVRFDGRQFIIRNDDTFDWSNVKLELNGGLFSGGYELKEPAIKGKTTYTVGALRFANSDGTRFNPFTMKPQKLTISADTPDGYAFYVGGWN